LTKLPSTRGTVSDVGVLERFWKVSSGSDRSISGWLPTSSSQLCLLGACERQAALHCGPRWRVIAQVASLWVLLRMFFPGFVSALGLEMSRSGVECGIPLRGFRRAAAWHTAPCMWCAARRCSDTVVFSLQVHTIASVLGSLTSAVLCTACAAAMPP
jgi:hypothetical protein